MVLVTMIGAKEVVLNNKIQQSKFEDLMGFILIHELGSIPVSVSKQKGVPRSCIK